MLQNTPNYILNIVPQTENFDVIAQKADFHENRDFEEF